MSTEQTTTVRNSIGRLTFVGLSFLIQLGWIILLVLKLNRYSVYITLLSSLLALVLVLKIYGMHINAAFKLPWIMLILVFPVMGACMYLLLGRSGVSSGMKKRFAAIDRELEPLLVPDAQAVSRLRQRDPAIANQSYYIANTGKFPLYQNTDVTFYAEAADGLEAQKEALRQAKDFIFMEYHAIEDSTSFHSLKAILAQKAAEGVEVRVLYDDVGSVGFINTDFIRRMAASGIQCRVFNPLLPVLNVFMNNRDHRKITVVDGKIGFTGGYNLADEYFNLTHPYGQWKDTGLKLVGDSVRSLTVLFLEMWNVIQKTDTDFARYLPAFSYQAKENGFVQPYADSPLDVLSQRLAV